MTTTGIARISESHRERLLSPPTGRVRLVIDADAANEIDDQFALTWAMQSPDRLDIEAVLAAPYSFEHLRAGLLEAAEQLEKHDKPTADSGLVDRFSGWAIRLRDAGVPADAIEFVGPAEGMERSFQEIARVFDRVGVESDGRVFRGSPSYLPGPN